MPQIKTIIDKTNDKRLFYLYLFHPKYLSQWGFVRNSVLNIFGQLKQNLENGESQEQKNKILNKFIDQLYQKHKPDLEILKKHIEKTFNKYNNDYYLPFKNLLGKKQ